MRNGIVLKMFIATVAFSGLLTGCIREPELLSDQQFNGKFYRCSNDFEGGIDVFGPCIFRFDGTSEGKERVTYYVPNPQYENAYYEFSEIRTIEIQVLKERNSAIIIDTFLGESLVSNGKWQYRNWNDRAKDEAKWTQWFDYSFSDDGTIFVFLRPSEIPPGSGIKWVAIERFIKQ